MPQHDHDLELSRRFLTTVLIVEDVFDTDPPSVGKGSGPDGRVIGEAPRALEELSAPHDPFGLSPDSRHKFGVDEPEISGEAATAPAGAGEDRSHVSMEPTVGDADDLAPGPSRETRGRALAVEETVAAFADYGLVSAVVRPPERDKHLDVRHHAIGRADILVLDWDLWPGLEDPGQTSKRIISELLKSPHGESVRTVCIYTSDVVVDDIAAELVGEFGGRKIDEYTVHIDSMIVAVFSKPRNRSCSSADRIAEPTALPAKVVEVFTNAASSLTEKFAVAALAAVRVNSGKLLRRFERAAEPGLLGHRLVLPHPQDIEEHLRDALADEFNSILASDPFVGQSVNYESCTRRATSLWQDEDALRKVAKLKIDPHRIVLELLQDGVSKGPEGYIGWATRVFASSDEAALKADLSLGQLLQTRSWYSEDGPALGLGVIVERCAHGHPVLDVDRVARAPGVSDSFDASEEDRLSDGYYLCMLPLCDAARIEGSVVVPFLALERAAGKPALIVVRDAGVDTPLGGKPNLSNVRVDSFIQPEGTIAPLTAAKVAGDWYFQTGSSSAATYRYVGRLREPKAQWIAHQLGADASRVAFNDPEWLRLRRKLPA